MPRRLLRDGHIVADDWVYLTETVNDGAAPDESGETGLILTFDQWFADKPKWVAATRRLGVVLSPAHKVEQLAPDLARFRLVGAEFAGPSEGRGYTQGRLLRERYRWTGELRATGYVRRDQLFFLARCGFNSFELPDGELEHAGTAFSTFSAEYQPSNDVGLALRLRHR
jgi:uncharacterized protein (DUF934 family)